MYLNTVLQSFASEKKKFGAEDLYKLNEAIFNLPEEDTIDKKMSAKLFSAVQNVTKAYAGGRYNKADPNFFYDYVALLATMQNQHFFSQKQNKMMLDWLLEAVGGGATQQEPSKAAKGSAAAKGAAGALAKDIAKLEAENEELEKELTGLRDLSSAVQVIQTFKLPTEQPKAKAKSRTKGKGRAKGKAKAGGDKANAPEESQEA
eukprot:CAMPEP_0179064564 /NCGR_PEP_ID=MMETSP0796-20121207/28012_1 /TAXON_ID=73915 /ORGANISM="Pyrodinium bahamense, Strain pbaha01" /LENGTH=203 /DNA_ID=CAMNT_0020761513 /DNA_START=112 /DNA_END=723 /DNA_ORIENTATION=+